MPEHTRQWRTLDLLKVTEEHFREKKIDEARLHAEILLAHVLQESRMDLYLNYDRPVEQPQLEAFRVLCRDRLKGRPLQYITGEQIFYGYSFSVDERVLIPRPETELLFEYALERWQAGAPAPESGPEILDIGTGSGCLAVLFAITVPDARITAVDVSAEALEIAALNAEKHGVTERIRLLWFDVLPIWAYKLFPRLEQEFGAVSVMDMQAFNPPYTIIDTSSEMSMLRSFARRHLNDNPMIRQVMATMDMYCGDIVRIVKDFKIDVVILPLHTGHKDINAAAKIVSDLCRDIGVPFLSLGCDLFDEQYMTVDEVMEKISRFFHAMGLA